MFFPRIHHHGAVKGVTGSCHQLELDEANGVLVDCGAFQGADAAFEPQSGPAGSGIDFPVNTLRAVLLTHVHVDHVGRLPDLLSAGYEGPIYCSEPSAQMLPVVLEDSLKYHPGANAALNLSILERIQRRIVALPFGKWCRLLDGSELVCEVRLQRAGHILGSAYIEIDITYPEQGHNKRIVFSGDLGASHSGFLRAPASPERADVLVLESTYGDRLHGNTTDRDTRLERAIDKALEDHGTVLIPTFSIGRTQELLYEIEGILARKKAALAALHIPPDERSAESARSESGQLSVNWPELPVILDSPLARRFIGIYQQFRNLWKPDALQLLEKGRDPLGFGQLVTVDSHEQHLRVVNYLSRTGRPAIVIAGSGMCTGGRIVNYLKAMLGDPRHHVVFVGFQAPGTPGAAIRQYGPDGGYVELDRERYLIRAGVTSMNGYSAHADQEGLVEFVRGIRDFPAETYLVHGSRRAKRHLRQRLEQERHRAGAPAAVKISVP